MGACPRLTGLARPPDGLGAPGDDRDARGWLPVAEACLDDPHDSEQHTLVHVGGPRLSIAGNVERPQVEDVGAGPIELGECLVDALRIGRIDLVPANRRHLRPVLVEQPDELLRESLAIREHEPRAGLLPRPLLGSGTPPPPSR